LPILTLLAALLPAGGEAIAQAPGIEAYLQRKLASNPDDASAWRMLGNLHLERGDFRSANDALHRALSIESDNVAARYDLARLLHAQGRDAEAATEFSVVVELAPESEYGRDAAVELQKLPPPKSESPYRLASYAYPNGTFDGSQRVEDIEQQEINSVDSSPPRPLHFQMEFGLLYNSNVALAPVSRELSPANPASFQAAVRPDLQYDFFDDGTWRSSVLLNGNFTWNEGNFQAFDLQSYRPGVFLERYFYSDVVILVPRAQYRFDYDAFGGATLGTRNEMVNSLAAYWCDDQASFLYWSLDYTDFRNDGALPSVTSRDGWTNALGAMHQVPVNWGMLSQLRGGADVELVDTVGSDYAFNGVSLYTEAVFLLAPAWQLSLEGGWGYRDYPDYQFTPSRNESIWRAGTELRYQITKNFFASGQFHFTRFDSESPLFQAQRYLTGLLATYRF
jgi:predicted TPR repeat methyltransferase